MRITTEIPDELYRQVKARSVLEGRPVREVVIESLRWYVGAQRSEGGGPAMEVEGETLPPWFGILGGSATRVARHDMKAICDSIAHGVEREHER